MTVDTIFNIAMWIVAFALIAILVVAVFRLIWIAIKSAWEDILADVGPGARHFIPNSAQPIDHNDGHFIDDPMAVVNTKPDFKGIGDKPIPATKNCIIINGTVYAYRKAIFQITEDTICNTCDLRDFCDKEVGKLLCSIFTDSDEDGCHFERI